MFDLNELILLNQNETNLEKNIKKVLFIFILIIIPIFEIIALILQAIDIFNTVQKKFERNIYNSDIFLLGAITFCSFISLICTWSMMSVCYNDSKCIIVISILKNIFIIILFLISYDSDNFYYYLVFNVVGYGIFYTLLIIYKTFKKGIL